MVVIDKKSVKNTHKKEYYQGFQQEITSDFGCKTCTWKQTLCILPFFVSDLTKAFSVSTIVIASLIGKKGRFDTAVCNILPWDAKTPIIQIMLSPFPQSVPQK